MAGASAVLVDFHPHPEKALCDAGQALTLDQVPRLAAYVRRVRATYEAAAAAWGAAEPGSL